MEANRYDRERAVLEEQAAWVSKANSHHQTVGLESSDNARWWGRPLTFVTDAPNGDAAAWRVDLQRWDGVGGKSWGPGDV